MKRRLILCATTLLLLSNISMAITLPSIFSDNMVLQRNEPVSIWGWSSPGETVKVEFAGQFQQAIVNQNGTWRIELSPMPACTIPQKLKIESKTANKASTLIFKNILIGDVWICCGQSNMAFKLSRVVDSKSVIEKANCPELRLFNVVSSPSGLPLEDFKGQWQASSPSVASNFSAVGYFFGRELHDVLKVPIGMIDNSVGGTRIQQWISLSGYKQIPELKEKYEEIISINKKYREELPENLDKLETWIKKNRAALSDNKPTLALQFPTHPLKAQWGPTNLFNAFVSPITSFAIRGVIWYQGESNWTDGTFYHVRMKALIKGWRTEWKRHDLPFYFVQLPPYEYWRTEKLSHKLPEIWDAQRQTTHLPNTGMVVTTDLGDLQDVHPKKGKDIIAKRLVSLALANTYGKKDLICSGPIIKTLKRENDKIRLLFDFAENGLKSRDGKELNWFEIAGNDHSFVKAQSKVEGNSILVWNTNIAKPEKVRFGWNQVATPNLVNHAGLPASPFQLSIPKINTQPNK